MNARCPVGIKPDCPWRCRSPNCEWVAQSRRARGWRGSFYLPNVMHNRLLTEENGDNTMQSLLSVAHFPGLPTAVSFMWKSGNPQSSNWSGLERENATSLGDLETFDNRRAQFGQFTPSTSIFLTVLMTLLVFATVLGNALVILAFVVEKSLRTQGNFFFLNLAIADFLVGEWY